MMNKEFLEKIIKKMKSKTFLEKVVIASLLTAFLALFIILLYKSLPFITVISIVCILFYREYRNSNNSEMIHNITQEEQQKFLRENYIFMAEMLHPVITEFASELGIKPKQTVDSITVFPKFYSIHQGAHRFHFRIQKLNDNLFPFDDLINLLQERLDQQWQFSEHNPIHILRLEEKNGHLHILAMFVDCDSAYTYAMAYKEWQMDKKRKVHVSVNTEDKEL